MEPVMLPSESEINRIADRTGLLHFVEKTGFSRENGAQKRTPIVIIMKLNALSGDYVKGNSVLTMTHTNLLYKFIRELFERYPEAIKFLEENQLL